MNYPAPEQLLAAWRDYGLPFADQPRLVKRFISIGNNQSFLVEADNSKWVVRVHRDASQLGVDRDRELQIHRCAAEKGLAPAIKHASRDILITRYIVGQGFSPSATNKLGNSGLIGQVKNVHQLELDLPKYDYRQQLVLLDPANSLSTLIDDAIDLVESQGKRVLCHHDLSPENILVAHGKAIFIDWEYAAFGIDAMDFATLVCDCQVPDEQVIAETDISRDLLHAACRVYQSISEKWAAKSDSR